jgi:hypothetical protein
MRKKSPASALLLLFLLVAAPVNTFALTFNLDFLYDGSSPAGASPWLTVTFEDITTDQVRLTLNSANLIGSENVASWYFNINPTISDLTPFYDSGPSALVLTGQNNQTAGSASGFDIGMYFTEPFRAADQPAVYNFFGTGLTASSFDLVNEGGSFFSAAQVLGIGANAAFAWIADSQNNGPGPGPAPVAEPATMILLSCGMAGLTFFGRKKFFA